MVERRLAIVELLNNMSTNWSTQEIAEDIIEATIYDIEHGWTQEGADAIHNDDRDNLVAEFTAIYNRQLNDLSDEDLADEYCREILKLET